MESQPDHRHPNDIERGQSADSLDGVRARIRELATRFDHLLVSDTNGALDCAEQATALAERAADPYCRGRALLMMGRYLIDVGRFDEAAPMLEDADGIFRTLEDRHGRADALCRLGISHARRGRFAEALACYVESESIARAIDNDEMRGTVQICLGIWYTVQDDAATALEWLTGAIASLERAGGNSRNLMITEANIASLYTRMGDFERAIEHRRHVLEMARAAGDRHKEWEMLSEIGSTYIQMARYDEAAAYLEESLAVLLPTTDMNALARTYRSIGAIQQERGRNEEAYETFTWLLTVLDPSTKPLLYATICLDIGLLLSRQDNYREALDWCARSLELMTEESGTFISDAHMVHFLLATIHEHLGDAQQALDHLREFHRLKEKSRGTEQRQRLERTEERIETEKRAAALRIQRENAERLEQEMRVRTQELSRLGAHATQTGEFLADLKRQISGILPTVSEPLTDDLTTILGDIQTHIVSDGNWYLFEEQFRRLSPGFLTSLHERVPDLTPTELKICAFISMGCSSKEIAPIFSISIRSVETYRFRIRKKLGLANSDDLTIYLTSLRNDNGPAQ